MPRRWVGHTGDAVVLSFAAVSRRVWIWSSAGVLAVIAVAVTVTVVVQRAKPQDTTVTFEVTGTADSEMRIDWRVPGSTYGKNTEKQIKVSHLPWSTTVHLPTREGLVFLNAEVTDHPQSHTPSTSVACRISVNGHVVDTEQIEPSLWMAQCKTTLQRFFNPPPSHA